MIVKGLHSAAVSSHDRAADRHPKKSGQCGRNLGSATDGWHRPSAELTLSEVDDAPRQSPVDKHIFVKTTTQQSATGRARMMMGYHANTLVGVRHGWVIFSNHAAFRGQHSSTSLLSRHPQQMVRMSAAGRLDLPGTCPILCRVLRRQHVMPAITAQHILPRISSHASVCSSRGKPSLKAPC